MDDKETDGGERGELAAAMEAIRENLPSKQPGFFVYTPKGKPVKLKGKGITVTATTKKGRPGVVVTEESK